MKADGRILVNINLSEKVTVVIPVFNGEQYVHDTVMSALEANPCRVLVVNDGSFDGTLEVLNSIIGSHPKLEVITKENGGESSAINAGLTRVNSPYVLFLSADDLIDCALLAKAAALLDEDSNLVVAYPSWKTIDGLGHVVSETTDIAFSVARLVGALECLPGPGSVIRTSAIQPGRSLALSQLPDLDQWLRLVRKGQFAHIPETLAMWRLHDSNMSIRSYGAKLSAELDVVHETIECGFRTGDKNIWSPSVLQMFKVHWHRRKAIAESRIPFKLQSIRHLCLSLFYLIRARQLQISNPWTMAEVIGCLIPPTVWLRDAITSPLLRKSSRLKNGASPF